MTPEEFCRWLQGFAEISDAKAISPNQWEIIKNHLALVYTKVTPAVPQDDERNPGSIQDALRPLCADIQKDDPNTAPGGIHFDSKAWPFPTTKVC